MHSQRIDMYKGDYELFVRNREDKLKNQQKEYEAQKQYRDHIQVSSGIVLMDRIVESLNLGSVDKPGALFTRNNI